jgi:alanine dehydrogenase
MKVGALKEIKVGENRVALTPTGAKALVAAGHEVCVQAGCGEGSGFSDAAYEAVGASVVSQAAAWQSELILKVKEPQESEYGFLAGQIVFTYFHLAGVTRSLTETLLEHGTTAVAYETVEDAAGKLPLLAPMSGVAGDMAVTMGNYYLAEFNGGKGMLLGEVLGEHYGKVLVVGDGVVGRHAARRAARIGAEVHIAGRHPERAAELAEFISEDVHFLLSEPEGISRVLADTDLLVGAVLLRGAKAPRVVSEEMVKSMQTGSVIVDVSIDQGGCVKTARPTTHEDPVYVTHGVTHYCVSNMPGAYPRTSTIALTSATLPYALRLANEGVEALKNDEAFGKGVNTYGGSITCRAVAEDLALTDRYEELASALS